MTHPEPEHYNPSWPTANAIKVAQIQTQCMKKHTQQKLTIREYKHNFTFPVLATKGVTRLKFNRRQSPLPSTPPSSFPLPSLPFPFTNLEVWVSTVKNQMTNQSFYRDRSSNASCDLLWHVTRTSYLLQHTLIISKLLLRKTKRFFYIRPRNILHWIPLQK